jgi:hypothetical protein
MARNLLFHCYPVRGHPLWPWHIEQLLKYKSVWNGRKIIVIACDGTTESADQVVKAFLPLDAEIFVTRNQSYLAETLHFIEMLQLLETHSRDDATFYAHAKGVTHSGERIEIIRRWCDLMYRLNLLRPDFIDCKLKSYGTIGCLRNPFRYFGVDWHFSGTFFWLRHDLFSRNWRDISQERYGVEGYPGRHFKLEESYALNPEYVPPSLLYDGWISDEVIERWTKRFLEEPL